jgi:two-component system, cell cycle response regulator
MATRVPRAVIWTLALLGAWLVVYEANVVLRFEPVNGLFFGKGATLIMSFSAAALCLAGALRRRGAARVAWVVVAFGIAAWNAGDTYWTTVLLDQAQIPVPSWADAGYLTFPVCMFVAIGVLLRAGRDVGSRLLLVDGLTAALAVGAVVAAAVIGPVLDASSAGLAVNMSYAVSDLMVLGLVVGAVAVRGWRLNRMWALIGGSFVVFWIADTSYLLAIARDTYVFPGTFDVGWTGCFIGLAAAAWQSQSAPAANRRLGRRATLLPLGFAAVALGVLALVGYAGGTHRTAVVLAVASLMAVGVRLLVTFSAHVAMLDHSQQEALTDPLTTLGNRRALQAALAQTLDRASPRAREVLVLYDLDGFKHYNDSFGHPAGDELLARLGRRLAVSAGHGATAYRMGGDEFCILAPLDGRSVEAISALGAAALLDGGEGFMIHASYGAVLLPDDAADVDQALRTADQRMYAQKHGGRASARNQVSDALVMALVERDGDLGNHVRDVAVLAGGVARALGLDTAQCELIERAAALHDVGKVAIPDAILDKPGPLDEAEWAFLRRHTIVGERIVNAAPALRGAAEIVRASHERFDGGGYPDGLAGEEIPLGARIVAVCDAYDAMRTPRPYSAAQPEDAVIEELLRCRGSQFDAAVVDAFCALVKARSPEPEPMPVEA